VPGRPLATGVPARLLLFVGLLVGVDARREYCDFAVRMVGGGRTVHVFSVGIATTTVAFFSISTKCPSASSPINEQSLRMGFCPEGDFGEETDLVC